VFKTWSITAKSRNNPRGVDIYIFNKKPTARDLAKIRKEGFTPVRVRRSEYSIDGPKHFDCEI